MPVEKLKEVKAVTEAGRTGEQPRIVGRAVRFYRLAPDLEGCHKYKVDHAAAEIASALARK